MSHILCSSFMVRKDLSWPVKLFFAKSQSNYGRIFQQRNNNFFCYGGSYVFLAKDFCLSYSAQRISFSLMLCKTWDHPLSKILTSTQNNWKKYLHHVKRKQFLFHTKQLEKDQTYRRNIYVFWGQDMVRTNLEDMDLWGGAVLDKFCKVLLAMGHFKWERNWKKCRLIFGWPFHLPQMWQSLGWKVLLNCVVVVWDGK